MQADLNNSADIDEIIEKAFALACFIQGDRDKALAVVVAALAKLEVAAAAQVKRLYYVPARRSLWPQKRQTNHRTKVSLSDLHLLQRLIYVESEPYEKEHERTSHHLSEEELLVHFIKYLIRISIKRNSFYVALGISRLLHNYSTAETMEIYNVVVQDPERVKDDYYYRSRKARLIQEIRERFGHLINVSRGARGEERFQTQDEPEQFIELVWECLNHFSPWQTPCLIPKSFDPTLDEIGALASAEHNEEDRVEINRIHAVVHPDCYRQIVSPLKLEPPARRLSIPQFFFPNGTNNMNGPNKKLRRTSPPLDTDEMEMLKRGLTEKSARRKTTEASLLSIVVDHVERARLDLLRSGSVSFRVDDEAELFEVRALDKDDETLLATYLMSGDSLSSQGKSARSEIILEGGQKLTFELASKSGDAGGGAQLSMTVSYRETVWTRAASLALNRLMLRVSEALSLKGERATSLVKPALAGLFIILCVAALAFFALRKRNGSVSTVEIAANIQAPPVEPTKGNDAPILAKATNQNGSDSTDDSVMTNKSTREPADRESVKKPSGNRERQATAPTLTAESSKPAQKLPSAQIEDQANRSSRESSQIANSSPSETRASETSATRSVKTSEAVTALSQVRKIFLDVSGDARLANETSRMLALNLQQSQRLSATARKEEADAAFKLSISEETNQAKTSSEEERVTVFVRLVNEDGEIIWPQKSKIKGRYRGTLREVTERIVKDLLKDIRKSEAQK